MHLSRPYAGLLGVAFWLVLAGLGLASLKSSTEEAVDSSPDATSQLVEYVLTGPRRLPAVSPSVPLRQGDPVFYHSADYGWSQVGFIGRVDPEATPRVAEVVWYHEEVDPRTCYFEAHYHRGTFEDILATMLPPEKRQRIQERLSAVLEEHGEELVEAYRPVVEKSLRESAPILEEALKASVERHEDEFKAIGSRWEDEIVKQRIVPLMKEEVVPSIRKHAEPVARKIGHELWDRASLWRFGWRAIYDRSPLPDRDLTKNEWERFVREEAIPVFERHMEEILESQKRIFVDLSQNERIRSELEAVFKEILSDEQFQSLVETVVRESVIENETLHAVWTRNFRSEQAREAMRLAGKRLEPTVRQIGDDLFGTRETGIDPDFARVLRNQILGKDKRWVTAQRRAGDAAAEPASGPLILHAAETRERFPLVMMANEEAGDVQ